MISPERDNLTRHEANLSPFLQNDGMGDGKTLYLMKGGENESERSMIMIDKINLDELEPISNMTFG